MYELKNIQPISPFFHLINLKKVPPYTLIWNYMTIWSSRVCQENRCKSSAGWTIMPHFLKLALIEKKMKNGQKNSTNVCYKFLWHTACSFMTFYRDPINHLTDPYKKISWGNLPLWKQQTIFCKNLCWIHTKYLLLLL